MTTRTIALVVALALTGVGLAWTVVGWLQPAPRPSLAVPAMARQQIEPYTFVTQDMVAAGSPLPAREVHERGLWSVEDAVGTLSTNLVAPGDLLSTANAMPAESFRFVEDMGLEVVSFQAGVDRMVGGRLRPGSLVNLYGYGRDEVNQPYTVLVEPRLWVVAVSAGGQPVTDGTVVPDARTGSVTRSEERARPATLLTVAVPPKVAYHLIDALGAQGLSAWVTLAANDLAAAPTRPPTARAPTTGAVVPAFAPFVPTVGPVVIDTGWGGGAGR